MTPLLLFWYVLAVFGAIIVGLFVLSLLLIIVLKLWDRFIS